MQYHLSIKRPIMFNMKFLLVYLLIGMTYAELQAQINTFPYLEDFENNSNCQTSCNAPCNFSGGWVNDTTEGGNWITFSANTPSSSTGPSYDHTLGNALGKYVFFETSSPCYSNVTANLISPTFDFSSVPAPQISFWYHMYGATQGSLYLDASIDGGITWVNLWSISGQQQLNAADPYAQAVVSANGLGGFNAVTFRIRGTSLTSFTSDMAIDDFMVDRLPNITGFVHLDFNQNCFIDINELGIENIPLIIQPANIVCISNAQGRYSVDSLPVGTYTVTIDTTNSIWSQTCPVSQSFTVFDPDTITRAPDFGLIAANPCNQPNVSIVMPQMRRGFNSTVYVQACNDNLATNTMDSAYCIIELPAGLSLTYASLPYTDLGNNQYYFYLDTLYPGECVNFTLQALVSLSNNVGSTLCLEAKLYPQDSCVFDTTYNPYSSSPAGSVSPCTTSWDNSSLMVEGYCVGDSVRFVIYNTGDPILGDMTCFAPVRVYVDGQFILLDSIQLAGGDSIVFMFEGNGSTWILQADQHPLHPGNSNPNAHVENCGTGTGNGNGVVIQFPNDDADPVIDIYCGQVTAPLDPNDKTGFPGGLTSMNYIEQNQRLEYLIRFQNVGTDTAVNVVIRDTLSTDLNIFTVVPEVASHDYTFRMYGQRILEWTFTNIMLPDSNVNEAASNGFVKFRVDQVPNLPFGTVIENSAAIYFDFEAPVITNTYFHTIHDFSLVLTVASVFGDKVFDASLYPNPTTSFATLSLNGLSHYEELNIQVFDMAGRPLLPSINASSQQIPIDVSSLSKGMYLIQVQQQGYPLGIMKLVVK